MDITIPVEARVRLRSALLKVRHNFAGNDSAFAADLLHVSLNTYKKCVAAEAGPLRLKRQTLLGLCRTCRLDPGEYGITATPEVSVSQVHGGYGEAEFGFLAGAYVKYRRSLLTGRNFNRSLVELRWNPVVGCLSFRETMRYESDRGVAQRVCYQGDVYIHADRRLMCLLSIDAGEVRSELLHLPARPAAGRPRVPLRLRGLQLTHAYPKGVYQPTVTPVLMEALAEGTAMPPARTVEAGDAEHARLEREFVHLESFAVVDAALAARLAPDPVMTEAIRSPAACT